MGYIPDNYSAFIAHESEEDRQLRLLERLERELEREDDEDDII